jgi:hypothetical protein
MNKQQTNPQGTCEEFGHAWTVSWVYGTYCTECGMMVEEADGD